jgi:putative zinc finger/helix-turn-helix YgiT family protein
MDKDLERESESTNPHDIVNCPGCGSTNVGTSQEDFTFPYGIGKNEVELSVEIPVRKCLDCGFSFRDSAADDVCHEAVCRHLGVMTPSQIKSLRNYYNLTQAQFSEITRLGEATLSRWERGVLIQNQAYDNYLRLLQLPLNFERIRSQDKLAEAKEISTKAIKPHFRTLKLTEEINKRKGSFKFLRGTHERPAECM